MKFIGSMEKIKYTNGYYDRDDDKIVLIYRNGDSKLEKRVSVKWYFLVSKADVRRLPIEFKDFVKEPWGEYLRIFIPYRIKHRYLKYLDAVSIKPLEFDLDPLQRFMVDNQIEVTDQYKIGYFDIETDDRNDMNIGKDAITAVSFWTLDNKSFSFCSQNESEVLLALYKEALKYDILVGWNSVRFERAVIDSRFEILSKINSKVPSKFPWEKVIHIDLMDRLKYAAVNTGGSLGLDKVGKKVLNEGKLEVPRPLYNLLLTDPELLKKYNLHDCILTGKIDAALKISELMIRQASFCGIFLSQFYISTLLDGLMFKYSKARKMALPTRYNGDKEEYLGAEVLEPKKGLFKNVCIFDFNSLYPNIIRSWNISFDSKLESNAEGDIIKSVHDEIKFSKNQGLFFMVINNLLEKRAQIKQQIKDAITPEEKSALKIWEMTYKELANSLYGLTGNAKSRFYDLDIAQSITLAGRYCLNKAKEFFESKSYSVLSGDTDSVFVHIHDYTPELIPKLLDEFHAWVYVELKKDFNIDKAYIKLGHECHYQKFLVVMKKNYVGWDGVNYKIKGLELIKKDTIYLVKMFQYYLLHNLMKTDKPVDFYVQALSNFRDMLRSKPLDVKYLTVRTKITKKLSEYKSSGPHVRLAKKLGLDHMVGETLEYVFIDSEETAADRVKREDYEDRKLYRAAVNAEKEKALNDGLILATEYKGEFDRAYYWEHKCYNAISRLVDVVFTDFDWEVFSTLN